MPSPLLYAASLVGGASSKDEELFLAYGCDGVPIVENIIKHTATLIGSKLFVFGGGDGLRLYNDLFCLDIGISLNSPLILYFLFTLAQ